MNLYGRDVVTKVQAGVSGCCSEHIQVVIGVAGLDIGIGIGSALGMIIGSEMGVWQESECGMLEYRNSGGCAGLGNLYILADCCCYGSSNVKCYKG